MGKRIYLQGGRGEERRGIISREERRVSVAEEIPKDAGPPGIVSNVVISADKEIISGTYITRLSQRLSASHS